VANEYIAGRRRFTSLAPGLVRMEFSPDGRFEDRRSLAAAAEKQPIPFQGIDKQNGTTVLDTGCIKILTRENDNEFFPSNLQIQWYEEGMFQHWSPGDKDHENLGATLHALDLYGLDARLEGVHVADSLPLDSKAGRWQLPFETHTQPPFHPVEGKGVREEAMADRKNRWGPIHAAIRYEPETVPIKTRNQIRDQYAYSPGILSRAGYCLLNDSWSAVLDEEDFPIERKRPGHMDWYFFCYGNDYRQGLKDFILLSGRAPLPGKNTFGIFFSRFPAYDEQEAREIVDRFEEEMIPLSVLVIDMEWHKKGWCHWDWNKDFYPDPPGFFDWAHKRGIQVTLNVHPDRIDSTDSHFEPLKKAVGEFTYPPAETTRDGETITEQRLNLCRKEEARPFFEICQKHIVDAGLDFWWLDGEAGWINGSQAHLVNNKFFYEDCEAADRRGMLLSRSGGVGSHRYGVFFTGDTFSDWKTLAMECEFNIRAGHLGIAYVSHDIGGFIHPKFPLMNPVLYIRWLQFGVFNPVLRFHSSPGSGSRQPWDYGETNFRIARKWLAVRNSLIPYIYTAARRHYEEGLPLVRGLFLDHPKENAAYRYDQFYFGNDFLVAPVLSEQTSRDVYLPEGRYYEFESARIVSGGKEFRRPAALEEIPLYVRAGAIIPRQQSGGPPAADFVENLVLDVYPGEEGRGELYEDVSRSRDYENGGFCRTRFFQSSGGKALTLAMEKPEGKPLVQKRRVAVHVYTKAKPANCEIDGKAVDPALVVYDSEKEMLRIDMGKRESGQPFELRLAWP